VPDAAESIELVDGRLRGPAGPLPAGAVVSVQISDVGLTLVGGDPRTAWQIPFAALHEPRCRAHRDEVELAGWVAGTLLMISFPAGAVVGASPEEIDRRLAIATGRSVQGDAARPRPRRRRRWLLLVVGVLALAGAGALLVAPLVRDHAHRSAVADRAAASAMNLRARDLPSGWAADQRSTSPLGGFLSTGGSGHETPAQKKVRSIVIAEYQRCMRIPDSRDRVFGAAGVTPPVEVGGLPFAMVQSTALTEIGTVTQRYASTADVAADQRQIASPRFPTCFAEALGRFATAGTDPAKAKADLPVERQSLHQPLGALVTGATVTIPVTGATGPSTAQLGVTVLVSGHFEQTLYTLAMPGSFPAELRQQVVGELAARLAGVPGARSA
jgi:hypothetical protein